MSEGFDYDAAQFGAGGGGGAGEFLGGIIAEILNAGTYEEAEALRQQAMQQYNIDIPPAAELKANAVQSQAAGAQGNARAKTIRSQALEQLSGRASEGYNAEDRAAVNDITGDIAISERGRRERMMQGISPNSGAALAARMSSQQQAANQANRSGLDLAGQSRRQALSALSQTGGLAGDIDTSEFGQAFSRGQAGDAISRFNEENRMDATRFNAQQQQQHFGNQMDLANAKSGAYRTRAEDKLAEAQRRSKNWRAGGKVVGQVGGAFLGAV